jgi:hypothetical protein
MPDAQERLADAAEGVLACLEAILERIDLVIASIPDNMLRWDRIRRSLVHPSTHSGE